MSKQFYLLTACLTHREFSSKSFSTLIANYYKRKGRGVNWDGVYKKKLKFN